MPPTEPERPAAARLIEGFANTVNLEYGTDTLSTPALLTEWLQEAGLLERGQPVSAEAHAHSVTLRAGIRETLGVNVGDAAALDVLAATDDVLSLLPLHLSVHAEPAGAAHPAARTLLPDPALPPDERALAQLAAAWAQVRITGDAARLKRCAEHTCELVFWDASKNRGRRWCPMRVCGNRRKVRRHAAHTPTPPTAPRGTRRQLRHLGLVPRGRPLLRRREGGPLRRTGAGQPECPVMPAAGQAHRRPGGRPCPEGVRAQATLVSGSSPRPPKTFLATSVALIERGIPA
ncbi:CGNR zinc finger domain-containing protein [Streptomyces sp. NBC_00448]|uniref:CGNR zinc finger domain-containing protein n=1 Tax=Streptomyces sp. NBC_00448 TaxID=2903652 RepID=UPI002E1E2004